MRADDRLMGMAGPILKGDATLAELVAAVRASRAPPRSSATSTAPSRRSSPTRQGGSAGGFPRGAGDAGDAPRPARLHHRSRAGAGAADGRRGRSGLCGHARLRAARAGRRAASRRRRESSARPFRSSPQRPQAASPGASRHRRREQGHHGGRPLPPGRRRRGSPTRHRAVDRARHGSVGWRSPPATSSWR